MDWNSIIQAQTIPAWMVGLLMMYTGWIWILIKDCKIRMSSTFSTITGITWVLQGLMYGIWLQFLISDANVRGFYSRLAIVLVCLAQSLPMTIAYARSRKNGKPTKGITSNNSNSN